MGHLEAAKELELLTRTVFAHQERLIDNHGACGEDGRVEEAPEGGWVGYSKAEVRLAPGGAVKMLAEGEQKPLRRWGRQKMQLDARLEGPLVAKALWQV